MTRPSAAAVGTTISCLWGHSWDDWVLPVFLHSRPPAPFRPKVSIFLKERSVCGLGVKRSPFGTWAGDPGTQPSAAGAGCAAPPT